MSLSVWIDLLPKLETESEREQEVIGEMKHLC